MHSADLANGSLGGSSSNPVSLTVGVLALQGGFHEHAELLHLAAKNLEAYLKLTVTFVRLPADLAPCDALVLPGGESTTITLLAKNNGLMEPLRDFVKKKPVWGTCAGMICLSKSIYRESETKAQQQEGIGGVDLCVVRNQYGRQVCRSHTNTLLEADFRCFYFPLSPISNANVASSLLPSNTHSNFMASAHQTSLSKQSSSELLSYTTYSQPKATKKLRAY
jgi:pyridoxal 5'-phosphate synthase glutaminase subunit Pdx2